MTDRIFARMAGAAALALALSACDSIRGTQESISNHAKEAEYAKDYLNTRAVLDAYYDSSHELRKNKDGSALSQKDFRDKVVGLRRSAIDAQYRYFVGELRESRVGTGLGADLANILINFTGIFVGGAGTKAALHGGSVAVSGAKGSFDKNVFYEKALAALLAEMDAQRTKVEADLDTGLKKSVDGYTLQQGLNDLGRLERAGSIEAALAGMTQSAETKKNAEAANLQRVNRNYSAAETKVFLELSARRDVAVAKVAGLTDAQVKAILAEPLDFRSEQREGIAVGLEGVRNKKRSDPALAKEILARWIRTTDSVEEMAHWEKKVGVAGR